MSGCFSWEVDNMSIIVEVGFLLNKDFPYYDSLLKSKGFINDFNVETHDLYYIKNDIDISSLSEQDIKSLCIRLRECNKYIYSIQNNLISSLDLKQVSNEELSKFENMIEKYGYYQVFNTTKKDHHYSRSNLRSKIQLQEIENVGLLLYYDNPNYYDLNEDTQRKKLIDDLNTFGFDFSYETLGVDKLRSLYHGKIMYSLNQGSTYTEEEK